MQGIYFSIFGEMGILGLSVYLWFAYSTIRWSFRAAKIASPEFALVARACKVLMVLGFIAGLWGSMHVIQGAAYTRLAQFSILMGFLLAVERIARSNSARQGQLARNGN
jgi:lysophospholipid acyltransferase (LPLAT)-like uncharacterized protein